MVRHHGLKPAMLAGFFMSNWQRYFLATMADYFDYLPICRIFNYTKNVSLKQIQL